MIMVRHEPSVNAIIQNSTDDKGYLIIGNDLLVDEVITATMFELTHDSGQYIAGGEDRHFGWGALLDDGHGGLV